jgi:N-acetylglucosamine kinase-like BadF-type ATPase
MGMRAIQAAVRAEDGRSGPTRLRDIVFQFLGLKHPRELIDRVHNRGLSREEMGALAPRIIAVMTEGDETAAKIVMDATEELAMMAVVTAAHLFSNQPSEMILVGGLALSGPPFQEMLIERIRQRAPSVSVREPEMSPVKGAVLEAMRVDEVDLTEAIFEQLRKGMA